MKFNKKQLELFFYTADERHIIYKRKEIEKLPRDQWTNDPIFKEFRFCNVYRKLDKVTQRIIKKVIEPYEKIKKIDELYKGIFISRFFSKIETIEFLVNNFDICNSKEYPEIVTALKELSKTQTLMTGSFMLSPLKLNKKVYPKLLTPFYHIQLLSSKDEHFGDNWYKAMPTIQDIKEYLEELPCNGGFMSYEYATDLTYSKLYYPEKPEDYYTYCPIHQGSLIGMNRLLGNEPTKNKIPDVENLTLELLELWNNHVKKTNILELDENNSLSMREVEHWLCEFDKYSREYNKETKRIKRRYT